MVIVLISYYDELRLHQWSGTLHVCFMYLCACSLEPYLAELGLWHATRPPGHLSVLLCGEDMGRTRGTVSAPHRMEGQSGWPQIHRTAGQQAHNVQFCYKNSHVLGTMYRLHTEILKRVVMCSV